VLSSQRSYVALHQLLENGACNPAENEFGQIVSTCVVRMQTTFFTFLENYKYATLAFDKCCGKLACGMEKSSLSRLGLRLSTVWLFSDLVFNGQLLFGITSAGSTNASTPSSCWRNTITTNGTLPGNPLGQYFCPHGQGEDTMSLSVGTCSPVVLSSLMEILVRFMCNLMVILLLGLACIGALTLQTIRMLVARVGADIFKLEAPQLLEILYPEDVTEWAYRGDYSETVLFRMKFERATVSKCEAERIRRNRAASTLQRRRCVVFGGVIATADDDDEADDHFYQQL